MDNQNVWKQKAVDRRLILNIKLIGDQLIGNQI